MRLSLSYLMAFTIIASSAIAWAQDYNILAAADDEREKRAIDFGLFVRNLLLKSAAASNVKSDITRNVAYLKATTIAPRRRTSTTTTTTVPPILFNKGPLKFPFDLSAPFNNKINLNNNKLNSNNRGYINFDYNDYGVRQTVRPGRRRRPTTVTTTTTTVATRTTQPPTPQRSQPTKRRPIPRRPFGLFGKQKVPQFEYYNDDDYNYNYEDDDDDTEEANSTTSAPAASRPPPPPPPPARPQRPPTAARARAQGRVPQLRNRFVYQFRQPEDTSTNNNNDNNAQPPVADSNTSTNSDDEVAQKNNNDNQNNTENNEETSANTNDDDNASDNAANNAQDDYIDPSNTSDDNNKNDNSTPDDFNFNLPFSPLQAQNQFNNAGGSYVPNFGNFGPPANFQYPTYNDYGGTQYQSSSPAGYTLPYY